MYFEKIRIRSIIIKMVFLNYTYQKENFTSDCWMSERFPCPRSNELGTQYLPAYIGSPTVCNYMIIQLQSILPVQTRTIFSSFLCRQWRILCSKLCLRDVTRTMTWGRLDRHIVEYHRQFSYCTMILCNRLCLRDTTRPLMTRSRLDRHEEETSRFIVPFTREPTTRIFKNSRDYWNNFGS